MRGRHVAALLAVLIVGFLVATASVAVADAGTSEQADHGDRFERSARSEHAAGSVGSERGDRLTKAPEAAPFGKQRGGSHSTASDGVTIDATAAAATTLTTPTLPAPVVSVANAAPGTAPPEIVTQASTGAPASGAAVAGPASAAPAPAQAGPASVPLADGGAALGVPAPQSPGPALGTIGAWAQAAPATAGRLLATPAARSIGVVLALAFAVFAFLGLHRRFDRRDQKLVNVATTGAVARFR